MRAGTSHCWRRTIKKMVPSSASTAAAPTPMPRLTPAVCRTAGAVSSLTIALDAMGCPGVPGNWTGCAGGTCPDCGGTVPDCAGGTGPGSVGGTAPGCAGGTRPGCGGTAPAVGVGFGIGGAGLPTGCAGAADSTTGAGCSGRGMAVVGAGASAGAGCAGCGIDADADSTVASFSAAGSDASPPDAFWKIVPPHCAQNLAPSFC